MKRSIVAPVSMMIAAALTGSCAPRDRAVASDLPVADRWITPPVIERVDRTATSLTVRGRAAPSGRVVLRGGEAAYAASADETGRFQIRIRPPATDSFMSVEVQTGQTAVPAPYRLLISHDIRAPIAMISAGAATVRLDPGAGLDAVDSDGRAWVASGRSVPDQAVALAVAGSTSRSVMAGRDGRWTAALPGSSGSSPALSVDGRRYSLPVLNGGTLDRLVQTSDGWALTWQLSPAATRTTWFPAREGPGS